jgi:hypothetical protein
VSILTIILQHQQEKMQRLNKLVLGVTQLSKPFLSDRPCVLLQKRSVPKEKSICSQAHDNPTERKAFPEMPAFQTLNKKSLKQNSVL